MNNLTLAEKRRLLSLIRQIHITNERRRALERRAQDLLTESQINLRELAYPSTNAVRNIVRRIGQFENTMNYHNQHIASLSNRIIRNYPFAANNPLNRTEANVRNSINRYLRTARSAVNKWTFFTGLKRVQRRNRNRSHH
jgi:hypothetical protein